MGFSSPQLLTPPLLSSYRSIQRKYATGRPDQKDLNENLAATQGLSHMITECQHLFEVRLSACLPVCLSVCLPNAFFKRFYSPIAPS